MRHKYFEVEENDRVDSEKLDEVSELVKPMSEFNLHKDCKAQVIVKLLRVRKGPGKTFDVAGFLTENQVVELSNILDGFGEIKNTKTWIDMNYVKIIE